MTTQQAQMIAEAISGALSFHRADFVEHCLGPCKEGYSFTFGVHRIADALERIAEHLENSGGDRDE